MAGISYASGSGSWLSVSPLSGTTAVNLSVTVDPTGLANGSYTATISFSVNNVVQTLDVTLTVSNTGGTTRNVTVSPTVLTFAATQGSSPAAQTVNVSSAAGAAGGPLTTPGTARAAPRSTHTS